MTEPLHLVVESDINLRHIEANGTQLAGMGAPTPTTLRWRAADPWAVHIEFTAQPGRRGGNNIWCVGWELLADAVASPGDGWTGDGDLRIRRATCDYEIRLTNPTGSATFHADARELAAFVAAVRDHQAEAAQPWIPDTVAELLAALERPTEAS